MSTTWVKQNAWQIVSAAALALVVVGQWQERQNGTHTAVQELSARTLRLEDLASQERARLDSVYLRRDLSDEQLRAIAAALAAVDKRLERIEGHLR